MTFIKLGGSIITRKDEAETANQEVLQRLAAELASARAQQPGLRIILGHGSGSFGHVYAARYGVHRGLAPADDWRGFALTAAAALRLNRIVVDTLLAAGVPALSLQPSSTLACHNGQVVQWQTDTLTLALDRGLLPIVHGDVAFDSEQGSAIASTEALFAYLATHTTLQPARIILVGETTVYTADPFRDPAAERIPLITGANVAAVLSRAGGSRAVDVTGGMRSKLELMWSLIEGVPGLEVDLITAQAGELTNALLAPEQVSGTRMRIA
ncbi:MAG: isopentenyl phosphate kinase family protein [Chloroflexaceae bacterium]|nr:isopentenyl phosphate kinase family protein [Chloroflexaceae bacterium]NJL33832.1 isopentenyl phosphate kinase family protein [Chloroflexaceae bacterium]